MGRVVLEHPDGRRVSAEERDVELASANPFNTSRRVLATEGNDGFIEGRPEAEHVSLLDEGFKVVGSIDAEGHEGPYTGTLYKDQPIRLRRVQRKET